MPADAAASSPSVPDLQRSIAEARAENARLRAELLEAWQQHSATSEVLEVINSSSGDQTRVFETILKKAYALCGVTRGSLQLYDGEQFHAVALHNVPDDVADKLRQGYEPGSYAPIQQLLGGAQFVHVRDLAAIDHPIARAAAKYGIGTTLYLGLRRDGRLLGQIVAAREEVRDFSEKEIARLQNFAAQAVIAMENARLLGELRDSTRDLRESLQYQTATSDVLKVISTSSFVLQEVLDSLVESAVVLCGADIGTLRRREGDSYKLSATFGFSPEARSRAEGYSPLPSRSSIFGQVVLEGRTVHIPDILADPDYARPDLQRLTGFRATLGVLLRREGNLIGTLVLQRFEPGPFTPRQIELVETFADQAVIAMENARLLTEQREALERQTATTEVLEVINSSPGELEPVFEAILAKAMTLCEAAFGQLNTFDGQRLHTIATLGVPDAFAQYSLSNPPQYGPSTGPARLIAGEDIVHDIDAADSEAYRQGEPRRRAIVELGGARTILNVALRKEGVLLGTLSIYRQEVRPFSEKQIALLQNFAAQAVIAMENARLLTEQQEALEQQTAMAEVLEVINSSPANLKPVLDAMLDRAVHLTGSAFGIMNLYGEGGQRVVALHGVSDSVVEQWSTAPQSGPGDTTERFLGGEDVIQIENLEAYVREQPGAHRSRALADISGARSLLAVALRKDRKLLGSLTAYRREVRSFTGKQVALLQNFAGQAVIAMENARLLGDLRESLEQQTATSDVLRTISSSPGNLEAVSETLIATVARLCRVDHANMFRRLDGHHYLVASHGVSDEALEFLRNNPLEDNDSTLTGRVVRQRQIIHIHDVLQDERYGYLEGQKLQGYRTMLGIPLIAQDNLLGVFILGRTRVEPFTDKEIALAAGFADQAVIAIENTRLFEELRDRQAELRVTLENMSGGVAMFDAELRLRAWSRNFQQIMDLSDEDLAVRPSYRQYLRLLADRGEFGTENVDSFIASFLENTEKELRYERARPDGSSIEVRRNAVPGGGFVLIYMDITERKKAEAEIAAARDAAEAALERQTATSDILKVIAGSPTDVRPVLDAIAKAAQRFCGAADAVISLREGDEFIRAAHEGSMPSILGRSALDRSSISGSCILDGRTIHVPDISGLDQEDLPSSQALAAHSGAKAALAVPMGREGVAVGCILLRKVSPGSFAPMQIELLEAFAAQAVIAIENVRLFTELHDALEQQTATAEILRAISQSPTDVQPVLDAVVKAAVRFCSATDAMIQLREGNTLISSAHEGPLRFSTDRRPLDRSFVGGRAIVDNRTFHYPDVEKLDPTEFKTSRSFAAQHGFRAAAAAPLKREDGALGAIVLRKIEPGPFTQQQIDLLETFAAQAVIAIENVRLFTELRDSLERLKAAQANLIQAEKMASLGQLTAGIAHEIKNPLNFVNNFAGLSNELLDELKQAVAPLLGTDDNKRAEVQETMELLNSNLAKILEHGRRADGIVKSMLAHSRGGTGDWQTSNINGLIEEALNLAYHGARAQDQSFNVALERDFDPALRPLDVVPQDVTRVFLNVFGNGFYATRKRQRDDGEEGYQPTLRVSTRDLGESVEIRVLDNGIGIAPEIRDKLFQPFFTTKPTGEGTGLGLSISYDIVTQQHGGSIEVESEVGRFTEFTVRLPRARRAASGRP